MPLKIETFVSEFFVYRFFFFLYRTSEDEETIVATKTNLRAITSGSRV